VATDQGRRTDMQTPATE